MGEHIIITVVYSPASRKLSVNVSTTSGDPQVNVKDVLLALHAATGHYLAGLGGSSGGDAPAPSGPDEQSP